MAEFLSYESGDAVPAEVSFDADFLDDAEFRGAHPFAVIAEIRGFAADEDGQPGDDVADALYDVESAIESAVNAAGGALVATATEEGVFTIVCYAATGSVSDAVRAAAGKAFAVDVHVERDDSWSEYERYALRGEELEGARDAAQIEQLAEEGADLHRDYAVLFDVQFPEPQRVPDAAAALEAAAFTSGVFEEDGGGIVVECVIPLTLESLKNARTRIIGAIAPFGGRYEGWGIDDEEMPDGELPTDEDDEDSEA
jgi:hypothetical protein